MAVPADCPNRNPTGRTPPGGYKPKEKAEFSSTYQATEIRQVLDGREVLYYNALRNEYRVDSVDVEETYRRNIGA